MRLRAILAVAIGLGAVPMPAMANSAEAFAEADKAFTSLFTSCTDKATGRGHYLLRVKPQQVAPNPFTPALPLPTSEDPDYYDFLQYINSNGKQGAQAQAEPQRVTSADQYSGITEKYVFRYFLPAYRSFDPVRRTWSQFDSGRAGEVDKINVVNYLVTNKNGVWEVVPSYNIFTNGILERPTCGEIPPG